MVWPASIRTRRSTVRERIGCGEDSFGPPTPRRRGWPAGRQTVKRRSTTNDTGPNCTAIFEQRMPGGPRPGGYGVAPMVGLRARRRERAAGGARPGRTLVNAKWRVASAMSVRNSGNEESRARAGDLRRSAEPARRMSGPESSPRSAPASGPDRAAIGDGDRAVRTTGRQPYNRPTEARQPGEQQDQEAASSRGKIYASE